MKDLVECLLNINITMQNDTTKKRLYFPNIKTINYYLSIRSLTFTKSIFLWLMQLNLFIDLFINLYFTKNKSNNKNCGKNERNLTKKVGNKKFGPKK